MAFQNPEGREEPEGADRKLRKQGCDHEPRNFASESIWRGHLLDTPHDHYHPFFHSKEVPRLDSVKPSEKHYSITLPTVSHSGFLYKTASAGKPLQDRRAREGGCSILPVQAYGVCQPGCRASKLGLVLLVDLRVPSGLWQSHLESLGCGLLYAVSA